MDEFGRRRFSPPFFLILSLTIHAIHAANATITIGQNLTFGDTLVSSGGVFELGFWSPGNTSANWYIAVWYKNGSFPAVVWIANRENPLKNKLGVLRFVEPGILALVNDSGGVSWSSAEPPTQLRSPVVQLLDSGNLVVTDGGDQREESFVWQSFDHPTDTYLPGMKLGWDFSTNEERYLSSWTSNDDPSPGEYSLHVDPTGFPQIVVKKGEAVVYRAVPLNGDSNVTLQMNESGVYYMDDSSDGFVLWRSRLSQVGVAQRFVWESLQENWFLESSTPDPGDVCDDFNFCGAYGNCSTESSPVCECLDGFEPNGSNGCIRSIPLVNNTDASDVFLNYSGLKLPDTRNSFFKNVSVEECREECFRNLSCMAFTELDAGPQVGMGCLFYYGDLIDIKYMPQGGQDLFIRLSSSQLKRGGHESKRSKRVILITSLTSAVGVVLLVVGLILILYLRRRKQDQSMMRREENDLELPLFKLSTILRATDNFSNDNRLGEGGFGPVYKGRLENGEEIAVKRLSKSSTQGVEELKNEVILIAKLQHRNLVRLLGCCVEGDENMLIYEFMPNKSLNLMLFDNTKSMGLDWQTRFTIINGVAKGLLYLHQDSRLRIVHRDLKASNILLDSDMNPRISDFGTARSFGGNETEVKTRTVVGTYGYMSPEYAANGMFSVKTDVFSLGVLVLEVVNGKRNRGYSSTGDHGLHLPGHAWKLDREGNPLAIVDGVLGDAFDTSEARRSIRVALLCVQKLPEDRPNMSSVVFMLGNDMAVPDSKEPGFYTEGEPNSASTTANSRNELSITIPIGR